MLYRSDGPYTKAERWLMLASRPRRANSASKYHGVHKSNSNPRRPWRASLKFDGRTFHGGIFETEEEAALCWNKMVLEIIGPEARERLNQISITEG